MHLRSGEGGGAEIALLSLLSRYSPFSLSLPDFSTCNMFDILSSPELPLCSKRGVIRYTPREIGR